jgi:hypothetical protein
MRTAVTLAVIFCMISTFLNAQQRLDPKGMNYVLGPKTNTIIFHDTVFSGKKQFEALFYRTHDQELIQLLKKHQTNKIVGHSLAFAGMVSIFWGVSKLSSSTDKSTGWIMIGSGFAATLGGSYFLLMGQRNLTTAVTLFNQRSSRASFGIGVADKKLGLVYNF